MLKLRLFLLIALGGCSTLPIVDSPSANHNSRVNYLIVHFTAENFAESLRLLTQRTDKPVSAHYLVPEPGDDTYGDKPLKIHRLVAENRRAWHAGASRWGDRETLNDQSIGIEIVNQSTCVDLDPNAEVPSPENQVCTFYPFPDAQVALVSALMLDILQRYPDIDPVDVIGHGDIAPSRRVDPGPLFPWRKLYEMGIGAWYDDETVARFTTQHESLPPSIAEIQAAFATYGYNISVTGEVDVQTRFVLRAFQMHFRPRDVTGELDAETVAILYALNEKYRTEPASR